MRTSLELLLTYSKLWEEEGKRETFRLQNRQRRLSIGNKFAKNCKQTNQRRWLWHRQPIDVENLFLLLFLWCNSGYTKSILRRIHACCSYYVRFMNNSTTISLLCTLHFEHLSTSTNFMGALSRDCLCDDVRVNSNLVSLSMTSLK